MQVKIIIFLVATLGIIYISRKSLRRMNAHGFYRFLSWEAILVLILLNIDFWFVNPFSPFQILSWICLFSSFYPLIGGVSMLRKSGRSDHQRDGAELYQFERTTVLVTSGIFRFIRHPMYSSLLLLAWGVYFKAPNWITTILVACATLFLTVTARVEEVENIAYFGNPYREYIKKTKMFIPFLF
jgi:protein-S-isoprenylcysteine O-methyltransferase Ste14